MSEKITSSSIKTHPLTTKFRNLVIDLFYQNKAIAEELS